MKKLILLISFILILLSFGSVMSLSAAVRANIDLTFDSSQARPTSAYSGKKNILAGIDNGNAVTIRFYEKEIGSWNATSNLEFTLTDFDGRELEGVKFHSFNIYRPDTVSGLSVASQTGNKITLKADSSIADDVKASFLFNASINAAADFTGDVYINVGGNAVEDEVRLNIARISAPISVTATRTNVAVGWQTYSVADISIIEKAPGVLSANKDLTLSIKESIAASSYATTDITFNPIKEDSLKIDYGNIVLGTPKFSDSHIKIPIDYESTRASQFTISRLGVKIYKFAAQGNYAVVIGGDSWVETFDPSARDYDNSGMFQSEGLVFDYIQIGGHQTGDSQTEGMRNIQVVIGTSIIIIDDKEETMPDECYIDPVSNRAMLPLRAVANALGIPNENVIWDGKNNTVTIMYGSGSHLRTVTFKINSSEMILNGIPITMADENGVLVKATINPKNNRVYIPLRQLGIALGIDVAYINMHTPIAVLNPTPKQIELARISSQ